MSRTWFFLGPLIVAVLTAVVVRSERNSWPMSLLAGLTVFVLMLLLEALTV